MREAREVHGARKLWGIRTCLVFAALGSVSACRASSTDGGAVTISGSALGTEGALLKTQIARYVATHAGARVELQPTPDDATQRHQLYVQWLNAEIGRPDILQLDIAWTPEFAAAGWILPLDQFAPPKGSFFPQLVLANSWLGAMYAVPLFTDVGLLYRRTDLVPNPPQSQDEMAQSALRGMRGPSGAIFGIVWQGARYEGLVTVFQEYLGAFGGQILSPDARVVVDSPAGIRALSSMLDQLYVSHIAPAEVLTFHEEEARFAFQNGASVYMRNWPYAASLLDDSSQSRVAGRFAIGAMPGAPGGHATAALGGQQLAVNARSVHPRAAYELIAYLTAPEQMLERAKVTRQFPPRPALYGEPELASALGAPPTTVLEAIRSAVPRPPVPIWTQLSELLQIQLHRALTRQVVPEVALKSAARDMNALIERTRVRDLMLASSRRPADSSGAASAPR